MISRVSPCCSRDSVGLGGDDRIEGLGHHDLICGNDGADWIAGGSGEDTVYGYTGADHIEGGPDADDLIGYLGDDFLDGGPGVDVMDGDEGNDVLLGGDEPDCPQETCVDTMSPGLGDDRILGGDGPRQEASVTFASTGRLTVNLKRGFARSSTTGHDHDRLVSVVAIRTGHSDDRIVGDARANRVFHSGGHDVVRLGAGDDFARARSTSQPPEAGDVVRMGRGDDTLQGDGGPGARLFGGPGNDILDVRTDFGDGFVVGGGGDDTITALGCYVVARGGAGQARLVGGTGDDVLHGGREADVADGGQGVDECWAEDKINCELR